MHTSLPFLSGVRGPTVHIDEKEIKGRGGPLFPTLVVLVDFDFTYPFSTDSFAFELQEVRCRLVAAAQYLTPAISVKPPHLRVTAGCPELNAQRVQLEFPLDLARVMWLERQRKGGDMNLRLEFDLLADQWLALGPVQRALDPPAWGLKAHHRSIHNLDVLVPRSEWVKQVLPETGYGSVHLLELPRIPLERCSAIEPAVAALKKAHKLLSDGHWVESVASCRLALEPFFEPVEILLDDGKTKTVPKLKSSWEMRLGKATYEWLNSALGAIKAPGNKAVHSTTSYFDEVSAQMLLTVTTALVAYAAQSLASSSEEHSK